MSGPRLSKEKRLELRMELGEQVAAGIGLGTIVKNLSTKYGIGGNAIRWHHKKVIGQSSSAAKSEGPAPKAVPAGRGRPKRAVTIRPVRKRGNSIQRGRPNSFKSLASALSKISPADLRRAIKASKLQGKHDALVAQASELRHRLKEMERRALILERRVEQLLDV